MPKSIGAFEAKTHFSELLKKVANGENIIITKHGEEVAMIIPLKAIQNKRENAEDAIETIRKLRKGITLGKKLTLKQLISEGRA